MIAMVSSSLISSRAPISSHVTSGTVANPSRFADGWTWGSADCNNRYIDMNEDKMRKFYFEKFLILTFLLELL